jgi:glutaredoxin-like protein NrdH
MLISKAVSNKEKEGQKMDIVKVPGKNNKHKVLMYALSTCAWCKKTKKFLKDNNVEFEYVDVDLTNDEDHDKIRNDIIHKGGSLNYPTIIVDNKKLISGYSEDEIREALEI